MLKSSNCFTSSFLTLKWIGSFIFSNSVGPLKFCNRKGNRSSLIIFITLYICGKILSIKVYFSMSVCYVIYNITRSSVWSIFFLLKYIIMEIIVKYLIFVTTKLQSKQLGNVMNMIVYYNEKYFYPHFRWIFFYQVYRDIIHIFSLINIKWRDICLLKQKNKEILTPFNKHGEVRCV